MRKLYFRLEIKVEFRRDKCRLRKGWKVFATVIGDKIIFLLLQIRQNKLLLGRYILTTLSLIDQIVFLSSSLTVSQSSNDVRKQTQIPISL